MKQGDGTAVDIEKFLTNEIFEAIFELNKTDIFDHYEITQNNDSESIVKYCLKNGVLHKDLQHYIDFRFKTIKKERNNKIKFYIVGEENNDNSNKGCYYLSNYTKLHVENIIFSFIYRRKRNGSISIKADYATSCCYKNINGVILENLKLILEKIVKQLEQYLKYFHI